MNRATIIYVGKKKSNTPFHDGQLYRYKCFIKFFITRDSKEQEGILKRFKTRATKTITKSDFILSVVGYFTPIFLRWRSLIELSKKC